MTSARNFLVALAAIAVVGALAYQLTTTREVEVAPPALESLPAPSAAYTSSPSPSTSSLPGNAGLPAIDQPSLIESQGASAVRMNSEISRLEKVWTSDRPDPENAAKTERGLIEETLSPLVHEVKDQPSAIVDVACRSTMCRIESDFPMGASGTEWGTRMLMEMGATFGTSSMYFQPGKDGATRLTIYAFRLGKGPQ